jgi:hypothetical protein
MKYIEAPNEFNGEGESVFLAGGITNCGNWQKEMVEKLNDLDINVLNPRREHYPSEDSKLEEEQIKWEFENLRKATIISFWFSKETLNPITLLELGSWLNSDKKLFIGIDPDYKKKFNLITQIKLVRPEIEVVFSLNELVSQIKDLDFLNKLKQKKV